MGLFGPSRAAPPRFGCFGKLPNYGDFLSLNADGDEAAVLTGWLQQGVGTMPPALAVARDQFVHYVWRPDGGRRTLVGVLWPSADAAGRTFPFTIFASLPAGQVEAYGPRVLLGAAPVRRRIHEIFSRVAGMQALRDQYVTVGETPVPPLADAAETSQGFAARAAAPGLRREDGTAYGLQLHEIDSLARGLLGAPEIPDFAVRIRLQGGVDPDTECAAWATVLATRLDARDLQAATFLRIRQSIGESLFLFGRALVASDLAFLLAPHTEYRYADSVGYRAAAGAREETRAVEAFQRTWVAHPPSLATVLEAAGVPVAPVKFPGPAAPEVTTGEQAAPARRAPEPAPPPAPPPEPEAPPRVPSAAETLADGEVITDEIVSLLTPAAAPAPAPARGESPTGPTGDGAPITSEQPVPAPHDSAVWKPAEAMARRILEIAAGAVLPGRIVRASSAAASATATGEPCAEPDMTLYIEDGGRASLLTGLGAEALARVEREIAANSEARRLLDDLEKIHRATESQLRRALDESCARTPRPGAA